jgi:hypothetical protein
MPLEGITHFTDGPDIPAHGVQGGFFERFWIWPSQFQSFKAEYGTPGSTSRNLGDGERSFFRGDSNLTGTACGVSVRDRSNATATGNLQGEKKTAGR